MPQKQATPAPQVLVAHLGDESVLLDLDTKHYFHLNATASAIWRGFERATGPDDIVQQLMAEFEVTEPEARDAIERLLADMLEKGLLQSRKRA